MAKEALKKLEDELSCSICLDTYTDPKLLECFHVYCRKCLEPLTRNQQVTCPKCRQVTPIPDGGATSLQSAFHINPILEFQDTVKKLQNPPVALEGAVGCSTNVPPTRNEIYHCFEHVEEELKLYCETCQELICLKCAIRDGKHCTHNYEELSQAFKKYAKDRESAKLSMDKQIVTVSKTLDHLDAHREEILTRQKKVNDDLQSTFGKLRNVLNAREAELSKQLQELTQGKLKNLAAKRDWIETYLAQLSSCLYFIRESISTGNEVEVMLTKINAVKQVDELMKFNPDALKPYPKADMLFLATAEITSLCQSFGQVTALGSPDPSKCHFSGVGMEWATVDNKATSTLQVFSFSSEPYEEPVELQCELVSNITGVTAICSVTRKGQSQHEISYTPTVKGSHQLYVNIEDKPVRGSPFSVSVRSSSVENLGTPILTIDRVEGPYGVAIRKTGEVVVTVGKRHCVSVFNQSGQYLRSFGTCGSGKGYFQSPCGVTLDCKGSILVADYSNCDVQKFTAEGQFLVTSSRKTVSQQLSCPIDVAFNACNQKVYLVDKNKHCVQVLDSDFTPYSTFGRSGIDSGHFSHPCGIACDNTGKVYVADTCNHRIQIFTAEGKFVRMFGRYGQEKGELDRPNCIAIDFSGKIYVSEGRNHRISIFTSDCQFVTSFGKKGEAPGEFDLPCGLAVDDCGVVYVCDCINKRVQLF